MNALQHDPNRPEDVLKVDADEDGVGGDDAADCLRYLVATKSRAVTQRKAAGAVKNRVALLLNVCSLRAGVAASLRMF